MGAWGAGAFENDDAVDWDLAFRHADLATGLRLITEALSVAARAGPASYLAATDGSKAVAAAELVAAMNTQPIVESPYNERARQWIARVHPSHDPTLTGLARSAVTRVISHPSELEETWSSGTELASWLSAIEALRTKLDA